MDLTRFLTSVLSLCFLEGDLVHIDTIGAFSDASIFHFGYCFMHIISGIEHMTFLKSGSISNLIE
jgi:hypothetical protein